MTAASDDSNVILFLFEFAKWSKLSWRIYLFICSSEKINEICSATREFFLLGNRDRFYQHRVSRVIRQTLNESVQCDVQGNVDASCRSSPSSNSFSLISDSSFTRWSLYLSCCQIIFLPGHCKFHREYPYKEPGFLYFQDIFFQQKGRGCWHNA